MKKLGLIIPLFLIFVSVKSQDTIIHKRIIIGAFTDIGINQPIRFTRKYVTEDVGPFHGKMTMSMGLSFSGMLTQKLRLEIATGYSVHKCGFELSPPIYTESKIYTETFKTFNLNASVYKYFRRNYFISYGTGVDFEIARKSYWIDSQNGFGFNLGVGKAFVVRNLEIDFSPKLEMHSVLPFNSVIGQQRLLVLGLRAGIRLCSNGTLKDNDIVITNTIF